VIASATGRVVRTLGAIVTATLPGARVGDGARIRRRDGSDLVADVTAIERSEVRLAAYGDVGGIAAGDPVEIAPDALRLPGGFALLGRGLDGTGEPLDGGPRLVSAHRRRPSRAPSPDERLPVDAPFWTGVRAIDGLLTIGRGARVGVFGAPGAGKSSLLEAVAGGARGDAIVLGLVGERGREAQRWLERLDARTTVICATSDRSAPERVRAAELAMHHAAVLRDRGLHAVLVLDSLARYAAAVREVRGALGEPAGRGGYPASVWAEFARYLERAGNGGRGSVTLLATVLSDGADEREPLADAARSLLDGHIVLSPALARAGRFPAIDVLASASRTMAGVVDAAWRADAARVRAALAYLAETADAREMGFAGRADPAAEAALAAEPAIEAFLRHAGRSPAAATRAALRELALRLDPCRSAPSA
jgi:type III secretion protein N (ATPase)